MPSRKKLARKNIKSKTRHQQSFLSQASSWLSHHLLLSTVFFVGLVAFAVFVFNRSNPPILTVLPVAGTADDYIDAETIAINAISARNTNAPHLTGDPEEDAFLAKTAAKNAGLSAQAQEAAADAAKKASTQMQVINNIKVAKPTNTTNNNNNSSPAISQPPAAVTPPVVVNTTKKPCITSVGTTVATGETMIGLVGSNGKNEIRKCEDGKWVFVAYQGDDNAPTITVKPIYLGGKNCYNGNFVVGNGSVYNDQSGAFNRCKDGVIEKVTKHTDDNFYNDQELKTKLAQEVKEAQEKADAEAARILALQKAREECLKNNAKQWVNDQCIDKPVSAQPATATDELAKKQAECRAKITYTNTGVKVHMTYDVNVKDCVPDYSNLPNQAQVGSGTALTNPATPTQKKTAGESCSVLGLFSQSAVCDSNQCKWGKPSGKIAGWYCADSNGVIPNNDANKKLTTKQDGGQIVKNADDCPHQTGGVWSFERDAYVCKNSDGTPYNIYLIK